MTQPLHEKAIQDLRPLFVAADEAQGLKGPCPACRSNRWKTKAEGFLCRICGYLRVPE